MAAKRYLGELGKAQPRVKFTKLPWDKDPLRGIAGLAWYERKPSSLSAEEWELIDKALLDGVIGAKEYAEWKLYVR